MTKPFGRHIVKHLQRILLVDVVVLLRERSKRSDLRRCKLPNLLRKVGCDYRTSRWADFFLPSKEQCVIDLLGNVKFPTALILARMPYLDRLEDSRFTHNLGKDELFSSHKVLPFGESTIAGHHHRLVVLNDRGGPVSE